MFSLEKHSFNSEEIFVDKFPGDIHSFMTWLWSQIEPNFQDLLDRKQNPEDIGTWLSDWTRISNLISERYARLNVAITLDTTIKTPKRISTISLMTSTRIQKQEA
jgi:hypothetical protein